MLARFYLIRNAVRKALIDLLFLQTMSLNIAPVGLYSTLCKPWPILTCILTDHNFCSCKMSFAVVKVIEVIEDLIRCAVVGYYVNDAPLIQTQATKFLGVIIIDQHQSILERSCSPYLKKDL